MAEADITRAYLSEIFPTGINEFDVVTGAVSQRLFDFVLSQIIPHAIAYIEWRIFVTFCIFNGAISVYSWVFPQRGERLLLLLTRIPSLSTFSSRVQTKDRSFEKEMDVRVWFKGDSN